MIRERQRLRPRRHRRPPPDAPARRLLRQAAAVPAGRLRHHRPGHRPRPHGARPWRGRFRPVQGERHRPGVRGRGRRQVSRGLGVARRPGHRSSTTSSTRPTGRSAPTCAKPARCSPPATSSTATRTRGGRRPRSSTAAPRNGSSRWTGRCRSSIARASPSSAGPMKAARSKARADAPPAGDARHRRHPLRPRKGPQPHRLDGRGPPRLGDQPPARLGRADRPVRRAQERPACWSTPTSTTASSRRSSATASTPGRTTMPRTSSAPTATPTITSGSPTSSTSGSTAAAPTSSRWKAAAGPSSSWPADLYLEGSDQHRGWFQSSLLESCGTRGRAPYDAVLTHGFTMDSKGMKMSKSLGNTINPLDLMKEHGADILRLWALSVDFTEDHRIGKEILAGVADQYRKLRNTFRYLLGALEGFSDAETGRRRGDARAGALHARAAGRARRQAAPGGRRTSTSTATPGCSADFANNDLSRLLLRYPQGQPLLRRQRATAPTRSAAPTAPCSTPCSTRWSAGARRCWCSPARKCGARAIPTAARCICSNGRTCRRLEADAANWAELRELRTQVTEAIEPLRRDKVLGSSLEAEVTVCPATDAERRPRRAVHRLVSQPRRCAGGDQDRQAQMRPLLAPSARSDGGRRPVRPLRGGGECVTPVPAC